MKPVKLRKIIYFSLLSCFLLILLPPFHNSFYVSASVETAQFKRAKIGLALGGGGALGFAHIGILKWLEENRIPVDYIAGTSMGGLIGGCYATGMSPDEISTLINNINWGILFNPSPPFNRKEYRRKEDDRNYPVAAEIGLHNGIRIPDGLGAYKVDLLLSRITLPYSNIKNFDELPIPFRCVATDIANAKPVVIGDESLAEAMRATMAVPGVFTPVKRNGQILVDGGVLNNVPADVAKQMGADIIIAVHLNANSKKDPKHESVLLDTINTSIEYNSLRSLGLADVVIEPEIGNLTVISWKEIERFINYGYQAAAEQGAGLRKFSVDEAAWQNYLQERNNRRRLSIPVPRAIEVTGASQLNASNIKARLKSHLNKPLDTAALERDLTDIMGSCLYENLRYEYGISDGVQVLIITATEKAYGPPFVNFAFLANVDGFQADHVDLMSRFRTTFFNITGPQSELRTDIGFGTELYLMSELYQPLFRSKWFLAPVVSVEQENSNLFEEGQRLNDYKTTLQQAGLDLGYSFSNNSELRIGYFLGNQDVRVRVGQPLPEDLNGSIHKARLKWSFTNTDDIILAKHGLDWDFDVNWYDSVPDGAGELGQIETKCIKCFPVNSQDLIFTLFAGGSTFQGDPALMQQFRLGGPFRLGSYEIDQFHGNNYLLTNIGYMKFLADYPLVGKVYLGFWLEHGGVFPNWSGDLQLKSDLSVGLLSPTLLGPIYIGASLGEGSNPFFNIKMGHIF